MVSDRSMLPGARVPFNRHWNAPRQCDYLHEALLSGHLSGDGPFTRRCQRLLESVLGSPRVLLTTSCTDALEMAALLLGIREDDEVVVPAFTFVSTVNAFVLHGARPRFADVRPDTLNLDEEYLAAAITPKTRAIVAVHYAGVACGMDRIVSIAGEHRVPVVEDNAHGLSGAYNGRPLGTMGVLATQSFHETKNFSCGEGGAIVINDHGLIERAEILRQKGTDRSRFIRGEVDKYTWIDVGSSFLPSDVLAAILLAQLEERGQIQDARKAVWERYRNGLMSWAADRGVRLPTVPVGCDQAYHMFYMLFPEQCSRDQFIQHMRDRHVHAVFHYLPLHLSAMGRRFGGREGQCPVTESVSGRLVRLPFYTGLRHDEQDRVIDAILDFREEGG